MNTKRLIFAGLLALALALSSAAQTIPGTTYTYGSFKPTLTVYIGTSSATTTQTLTVDIGQVPGPNGIVFYPLAAGAVGQSVIVGTGTNADTVTISAVNCYTPLVYGTCSFTAATTRTAMERESQFSSKRRLRRRSWRVPAPEWRRPQRR